MNAPQAFANSAHLDQNAEGVRYFQPRVGAQRQPWDRKINFDLTLKGFAFD
jgi:hypothetical protein